jgi:rare lipoprotein A
MLLLTRGRLSRTGSIAVLAVSAALVAACTTPEPKAMVAKKPRSKEYFAESVYGVKASPRVSMLKSRLPRGGGRDQVGKPYKVRGKWYYPKEDKGYEKVGTASWYGDAFHGRLTANGEVYDMTHLTAAHPTMPLPSYARVTNTANGSSVIVRVNDRGPYAHGRIIDLSKRAAEMLDYTHSGTADVRVEYVSRAPLDGHDDQFLMASYRPGNEAPDPSDGLPTGVMIAMNGSTPSTSIGANRPAVAFPGELVDSVPASPDVTLTADSAGNVALPALGPVAPERPSIDALPAEVLVASAEMSYAGEQTSRASAVFGALERGTMSADGVVSSWKRQDKAQGRVDDAFAPFIAAGSFADEAEAQAMAEKLSNLGRVDIESGDVEGRTWHVVNLHPTSGASLDVLLQAAWDNGAADAFVVHD